MLNTDSDVLNFLNSLKGVDFIDVYVVHPISIPLVVEEILVLPSINADVSSSPQQDNVDVSSSPHKNRVDLSSSPQIDRADVSSSQPFDENENRDLNQNQSPLVEEQFPAPRVEEHSDSDSLYDVDENIDDLSDLDEELLQARQSNIQEQVKEKTDRVNLDEIPSGPVGIDAGFEDIYKERRGRFEDNLDGDDPYFDSSDPDSDISEDEGDPVENDEMVDPAPRKEAKKKFGKATRKGRRMKCLVCNTFEHNKKGCPTLKNVAAATSVASAATAGTNAAIESQSSVNAGLISARRPTNDLSSVVRPTTALASSGRPTSATSSDVRHIKTKIKKAKTASYGLLFGSDGSVTERSGNTDRVLHSATLSSSTPTNIDLGYKPNGLIKVERKICNYSKAATR
ncbi:hypothetical protein KY289_016993 [Solanum tuberosum]|nr:hypothetical protein KY284_016779 [Solanum tuberosum]KAH0689635.1 hypothetical protein KY289_016993 [Solanum tuberosum]